MARIRSIKPGCFISEDVAALTLRERWTWVGLWTHSDDHGRAKDNAKLVHAAIWPLDPVTPGDVEADLKALSRKGRIVRYKIEGAGFLAIVGWHEHQAINRPQESKFPAPPHGTNPRVCTHGAITERSVNDAGALTPGGEGNREGEQGRGAPGAPEPPLRCSRHLNSSNDAPCGACGDARRAHGRWLRAEKAKPTPVAGPGSRTRCPKPDHEHEIAASCRLCRSEAIAHPDEREAS